MISLLSIDPTTYVPHEIHCGERSYNETNCYADILIELLHAHGHEPLAAMGFTVAIDFEGDQWTFFKPPAEDLEGLFGLDIHEMQPYRPLPDQIAEQLDRGRTMIVELDSFYLPDTISTAYRTNHVKSSAAMEAIDRDGKRLRYFHNGSLYELYGDDYDGVFRLNRQFSPDVLPPYTELVRFDGQRTPVGPELREASRSILRQHLSRRPRTNPFTRFGESLSADLPALLEGDAANYHTYAFATVRMSGAAFELCASHLKWLLGSSSRPAVSAFTSIVEGCKTLSFKLARRRAFDPAAAVNELAAAWDSAQSALDEIV